MASCTESSTPLEPITDSSWDDFQINEYFDSQDTERESVHMPLVTVPTIVTVEESSQTSEGKFDLLPILQRSFSPLPGFTLLAPFRDFLLAASAGESRRQPGIPTTDSHQISHSKELVVYTGERQSRTAIAPPMTSLEGAKVIFTAGTSGAAEGDTVCSDVRQTQSETLAREASETQSEQQVSAHTNTYNESLLALQEQLRKTEAERDLLLKQVVDQSSSSSTSAWNQLSLMKDDLANLKLSLIPKLNSIQESQLLSADETAKLPSLEEKISSIEEQVSRNSRRLDSIEDGMDAFASRLTASERMDHVRHISLWEGLIEVRDGMSHLNEGMKYLYGMVKDSRPPTEEERIFFAGTAAKGERAQHSVVPAAPVTLEDPSTKGEKEGTKVGASSQGEQSRDPRRDKGKEKVVEEEAETGKKAPDADYYMDEQGDFQDWGEFVEEGNEEYVPTNDDVDWENAPEEYGPPSPETAAEIDDLKADILIRKAGSRERSKLIQEQREMTKIEMAQRQEQHQINVEKRRLEVRMKEGAAWDHARMVLSLPSRENHESATLERIFGDIRKECVNGDEFLAALKHAIIGISCAHDNKLDELAVYVETRSTGTLRVSSTFFNDKTLTELYVCVTKLRKATPIQELFKERLWSLARKASPEVVMTPWAVRFIKSGNFQTVYLNEVKLRDYSTEHLVWLEHHLLNSGAYESKKSAAAMEINEYAKRKFPKKYELDKNRLKGHQTKQPLMPQKSQFSQAERLLDPHIVQVTEEGEIGSGDED